MEETIECPECKGSGISFFEYEDGDHTHTLDDECHTCKGKGYIMEKKE
jgi:DnaJ-class molecular chaperone